MLHGTWIVLHLLSLMVWIGSAASIGALLRRAELASDDGASRASSEAAAAVYRAVSTPAFVAAVAFGLLLFLEAPATYMRLHWFHGKLTAALVVIGLHHALGAKAKRSAAGSRQRASGGSILGGAILVLALAVIALAELKTSLVP